MLLSWVLKTSEDGPAGAAASKSLSLEKKFFNLCVKQATDKFTKIGIIVIVYVKFNHIPKLFSIDCGYNKDSVFRN